MLYFTFTFCKEVSISRNVVTQHQRTRRRLRRLYDVVAAWWERSFERVEEGILMRICRRMSWQSIFPITIALAILRKLISLWRNNSSAVCLWEEALKKPSWDRDAKTYICTESDQHRNSFSRSTYASLYHDFSYFKFTFCVFWSILFMLLGRFLKKFQKLVINKSNSLANGIKKMYVLLRPRAFFQILVLKP